MQNQEQFVKFLCRGGRTDAVAAKAARLVALFERFLRERGSGLDEAVPPDLEAWVASIESAPGASAKTHLWAVIYYYQFTGHAAMLQAASAMREERVSKGRSAFPLRSFRGVSAYDVARLQAIGVRTADTMIEAGRTPALRQALVERTGIPPAAILELVKLSDISRLGCIKAVRARLYYDAGLDTPDEFARWDPAELRIFLVEWCRGTGFQGIAPLPKEIANAVERAREVPRLVEYE
jgi:hypothetical protein